MNCGVDLIMFVQGEGGPKARTYVKLLEEIVAPDQFSLNINPRNVPIISTK